MMKGDAHARAQEIMINRQLMRRGEDEIICSCALIDVVVVVLVVVLVAFN